MQKHKKLSARILSMALSVAMVATMMPATVFATEGDVPLGASSIGTIQSFEKLEDRFQPSTGEGASKDVYAMNVELNTPFEDLNLPDELTAMVARTTTVSKPAEDEPVLDSGKPSEPAEDETIPDEDEVVEDDTSTDDTVSGNQPASPSDAKEEVKAEIKDEDVPLAPEPTEDKEPIVTTAEQETIPITWNSDKEYVSDETGQFIYTAVLPEGYILADGVELPQIYVAMGKQARGGSDTYTVGTGGTYSTLSAAYADSENVSTGTTLKLLSNMTESGLSANANSRIYIDLNGFSITNNESKPLFMSGSVTIENTGSSGGVIDLKGQNLGDETNLSTSSQTASVTIKNTTLELSTFNIQSDAYVIFDQSVTLESLLAPGRYLNIPSTSTLINNGVIKGIPGGIKGIVKNGATGKIYINESNVDSIDNTTSGGKVYVTGGSIKSITEAGNANNVFFGESEMTPAVQYIFTLNNGTADLGDNITFDALTTTPTYTYGMNRVKTRDTGKLYIWVPSGLTGASATVPSGASAGTYFNAAVSGTTATLTKPAEIGIGTQPTSPAAMIYGAITGSLTVAGTASNNNTVSYQWYKNTSNSTTGGTAVTGATSASFTIPTSLDAGTYYYYCVLKATDCADKASNVVTVTVNKANATNEMETVAATVSKNGATGATATLPTKPAAATYGTITYGGAFTCSHASVNGDTLTYTAPASTVGAKGTITIPVTTATNYNDYDIVVTITSTDKKAATITAAVADKTYNGVAVTQPTPTAVEKDTTTPVTLTYTYKWQKSNESGVYTDISGNTAPKDAGSYKLLIEGSSDTHAGTTEIAFTISKATVTITADNKSAYVGDAKPTLTYTATGLASGDTLATIPTLTYESEPDMSKAGSVKIKASGAVVPSTDNYESVITYVDGTLTISNKSSGGGGGGGGSSSGGGSSTTPPTKPTEPVKGESNTTATVDDKGNATTTVTDKNIADAVKAAKDAASKKGVNAGEVTAVINVTAPANSNPNTVTVNLLKTVQQQVINGKIGNVAVVIDKPDIAISMNLATITEMNKQANADIQLSATRTDATKLSTEAKNAIGNRPAFDLKATYNGGAKSITSFGSGSVSVAIPYNLQAGEVAGGLYAVYIDGNGMANYITGSSYDANTKMLRFTTNHFSVYGIGYKAPANFIDIAGHQTQTDIEFVVGRGLMSGIDNTTFSPNGAMTRGTFVAALGILAGVDTNSYMTSKFTDVKSDVYYAPYVNWAVEKGIASGTTATTFSPDHTVTRQEMAVFMSNYAKAIGYKVPETREAVIFADNRSIGSFAAVAVKQMQMGGVLNGKNGNLFDPTGAATRAEAASVLHRYVELVIDRSTAQGLDVNDSGSVMMYENGKMVKSARRTVGSITYNFNTNGEGTLLPADSVGQVLKAPQK